MSKSYKGNYKNGKKGKYAYKKHSINLKTILSIGCGIVALVVIIILVVSSMPEVVQDSDLIIDKNTVTTKASFYPVVIKGTKLEVLAVKAPDGSIRTAFNTCQVCYSSGRGYYKQEGSELVCQNCGNRFGMAEVGLTRGGCNPVPITSEERTIKGNDIIISKEFLSQAKSIFANWKN